MFGFLGKLINNTIGNSTAKIADSVDRFVETKDEKTAADIKKMKILQNYDQQQVEVNKIEAAHRSIFIAGWRPAIGWICALALAWGWVVCPILETVLVIYKINIQLPKINVAEALGLVTILLGNASLRSYEKSKGITK